MDKKRKYAFLILCVLGVLNVTVWLVLYEETRSRSLKVHFFAVGQGDAIFIETPQKQQVLIDGGPDGTILKKLAEAMPYYDRSLDLAILTHPEHDHLFGLLEVLKRYTVKNIIWTGVTRNTPEWQAWVQALHKEGAHVVIARAGQKILFQDEKECQPSSEKCAEIDILSPSGKDVKTQVENSNDTSIVSRLQFGKNSFLFTGDISAKVEQSLAADKALSASEVLKVAHHGSKTSTSKAFLEQVTPRFAVISVGKDNTYGHPHFEVLANLAEFGIQVLRTDQQGNIVFTVDKDNDLKVMSTN